MKTKGKTRKALAAKNSRLKQKLEIKEALIKSLNRSIACAAEDAANMMRALMDAVAFLDRLKDGGGNWTIEDVKRIEEIRKLSVL